MKWKCKASAVCNCRRRDRMLHYSGHAWPHSSFTSLHLSRNSVTSLSSRLRSRSRTAEYVLSPVKASLYKLQVSSTQKEQETRKLCYRKDDRAMRPIHGCPENVRDSLTTPTATMYYSQNFSWAFVPIDPMNVPTKFEVRSFTRSWDNRGYPKKLGSPLPGYTHTPFSPKFLMGFYSDWPCKCTRQIWSP